jgi:hypothetical protein
MDEGIRLYFMMGEPVYGDIDSLLVPANKLTTYAPYIGDGLVALKVEASGDDVIVVRAKQYCMLQQRYRNAPESVPVDELLSWYAARLN